MQINEANKKGYIEKGQADLAAFRKTFSSLTISDEGLVLKEDKIVLPTKLIKLALEKAHQGGHPGMNCMKRRIRSHFWFPDLNDEVEKFVKSCDKCVLFNPKYTKENLHAHHLPEKAGRK